MAIIIGCVSQKGGVGKSTLARLLAREFAMAEWRVLIADTDNRQTTSTEWVAVRNAAGIEPVIWAQPTAHPKHAPMESYDLILFDGKPHSDKETLEIAKRSRLIVIPTGVSRDDLVPGVRVAHDLRRNGINNFIFALMRVGSRAEEAAAREFIRLAGYTTLAGSLPERTGYRDAQDRGKAVTETPYPGLNERAAELAQSIIDRITGEPDHG